MPDATAWQISSGHSGAQAGPFGNHLVQLWRVALPAAYPVLYPLVVQDRVFVTYASTDAEVLALDLHTGRKLWGPIGMGMKKTNGSERAWATYDAGRLFVLASDGTLVALDPATGAQLWRVPAAPGNITNEDNAPPTASNGILFADQIDSNMLGNNLVARRESDGAVLWRTSVSGYFQAPSAANGYLVYDDQSCAGSTATWAFHAATGTRAWSMQCSQQHEVIFQTPAVTPSRVAISGLQPGMGVGVYSLSSGSMLSSSVNSALVPDLEGTQYVGLRFYSTPSDGTPYCLQPYLFSQNISSMSEQWQVPAPSQVVNEPLIVGGHVILRSEIGGTDDLWEINQQTGVIESEVQVDSAGEQREDDDYYQSMNAGDGVLVVPSESSITAFTSTSSSSVIGQSRPYVATTSLPSGTAGTKYEDSVLAAGGACPYTWALTGGSLPPGISFDQYGTLSGTPTQAGTFTFTVQVTDEQKLTGSRTLSLTING